MLNKNTEKPGDLWEIEPSFGKGYYWNFIIDDMMVVSLCELEFYEEFSFSYDVPDFFCFGKYNKNMTNYFYSGPKSQATERILGYAWKGKPFSETVINNCPLKTASISLLPEAVKRLSNSIGVNARVLASAISGLDGMQYAPGLGELFDSLFSLRPQQPAARAYYESKIVEACALLVDWWLLKQTKTSSSIRPADHSAINLVVEHIHENLTKNISLKELCQLSCMSASKLNNLFKTLKHKSPIEYARDAKLDYSCQLLANNTASIQEISFCLGFSHQGSFSEAFKSRYGISPKTYRRTHRIMSSSPGLHAQINTAKDETSNKDPRKPLFISQNDSLN